MTLTPPPTAAERVARRGGPPSRRLQWAMLVVAVATGSAIGGVLATATATSPLAWVAAIIPAGIVTFACFIAVQGWSIKAALDGSGGVWLRPGEFLAVFCLTMAAVAYLSLGDGVSSWRWRAPLIAGAVFVVLSGLGAARRVAIRRRREGMRARHHARGVVTDDGLAEFAPSPNVKLARITVRFLDDAGTERWLTPMARQVPGTPLAVGDEVDVWFDPAAPGDLSRILVEGGNGTSHVVPAGGLKTPR